MWNCFFELLKVYLYDFFNINSILLSCVFLCCKTGYKLDFFNLISDKYFCQFTVSKSIVGPDIFRFKSIKNYCELIVLKKMVKPEKKNSDLEIQIQISICSKLYRYQKHLLFIQARLRVRCTYFFHQYYILIDRITIFIVK